MTCELRPDLLRRVLVVMACDNVDGLFWREDNGVLSMYAQCSDFFAWGCSDCEPIETDADVQMLEQAHTDLLAATNAPYTVWIGELYAARRRKQQPAPFMLGDGKHALDAAIQPLFTYLSLLSRQENP